MEHSVQLGTLRYHDSICECLRELSRDEGLPLQISDVQQGRRWLIQCKFLTNSREAAEDEEIVGKIHLYYLANALAETILRHWEKEHIRHIIRKNRYLTGETAPQIYNKALEYLNKESGRGSVYRANRKTELARQILGCLDHSELFDIEGFLRFRAHEYKHNVSKAVDLAIEEYIVETEYLEFIRLLKHFVDSQTPQLERLHVGMTSKGKFQLFNSDGIEVTRDYLEDYQLDNLHELGYEDLLVSALIAVAPRQIILHIRYEGYKDTLQTIRHVFGDRVQDCGGCSLCKDF